MNQQDKTAARAAIERASVLSEQAKQEVIGLAKGTRKWTMCIPLRQDDSDTLLMNTFRVTDELAAHLKAALDALEACQEEAVRVRREALLEAVNKTCWMCAGGWELQDNGDRLYHDIKTNLPDCHATAIHRMIAGQKNVE